MEKKSYSVPEVEVMSLKIDIITSSYTEKEEWDSMPEIGFE